MTPQWAAVTTQFSLMREPPQKWKPVLSWKKMGRVSACWTPAAPTQAAAPHPADPPGACPLTHRIPLTCRDTCQGQEPGTASSPLTILERPLNTGWIAGTPQPGEGVWGEAWRPRSHPGPMAPGIPQGQHRPADRVQCGGNATGQARTLGSVGLNPALSHCPAYSLSFPISKMGIVRQPHRVGI